MEAKHKITYAVIVILVIGIVGYALSANPGKPVVKDEFKIENADQTAAAQNASGTSINLNADPISQTGSKSTENFMHTVTIETNKGTIVIETYDSDAPKTVENFVSLANKGFYDGVIFHRVIPNFMIQGGDPTGTGMGGPGYKFADELNPSTESYKIGYVRGTVAMANAGPNTNGSQFFIMHKDTPLPNAYTIFGRVVKGLEVVDAIAASETDSSDKPLQKIEMKKVTVSEK